MSSLFPSQLPLVVCGAALAGGPHLWKMADIGLYTTQLKKKSLKWHIGHRRAPNQQACCKAIKTRLCETKPDQGMNKEGAGRYTIKKEKRDGGRCFICFIRKIVLLVCPMSMTYHCNVGCKLLANIEHQTSKWDTTAHSVSVWMINYVPWLAMLQNVSPVLTMSISYYQNDAFDVKR